MRSFKLVSSLKVNFFKRKFGAIGVEKKVVERYAEILNCRRLSILFIYLGILIGANPRREETWKRVINKFEKKLALWKHKSLSFSGRVCPINSVLTSLPLFFLWFLECLLVYLKIERIQRTFLWGGNAELEKISWVSWKKVCSPKNLRGVRVKDLCLFNEALLAKWR